jgi:hypothetical protein
VSWRIVPITTNARDERTMYRSLSHEQGQDATMLHWTKDEVISEPWRYSQLERVKIGLGGLIFAHLTHMRTARANIRAFLHSDPSHTHSFRVHAARSLFAAESHRTDVAVAPAIWKRASVYTVQQIPKLFVVYGFVGPSTSAVVFFVSQ